MSVTPTAPTPNAPGQTNINEAPAPAATPETKPELISPKFAALARKEKELRRAVEAQRAREEQLKSKESEYQTNYVPKSRLLEDPLSALSELGITYDQIVQMALKPQKDPTIAALEKEIQALKKTSEDNTTSMQAQQAAQYEQALNQIRNDTKQLVSANAEFETIKSQGAEEAVVKLIEETFKADGFVMSIDDAAKAVEDYLVEEGLKYAQLSKVQARLKPKVEEQPPQQGTQPIKTLTNAATAAPSTPLSAKDRRQRAILAFKGQL